VVEQVLPGVVILDERDGFAVVGAGDVLEDGRDGMLARAAVGAGAPRGQGAAFVCHLGHVSLRALHPGNETAHGHYGEALHAALVLVAPAARYDTVARPVDEVLPRESGEAFLGDLRALPVRPHTTGPPLGHVDRVIRLGLSQGCALRHPRDMTRDHPISQRATCEVDPSVPGGLAATTSIDRSIPPLDGRSLSTMPRLGMMVGGRRSQGRSTRGHIMRVTRA